MNTATSRCTSYGPVAIRIAIHRIPTATPRCRRLLNTTAGPSRPRRYEECRHRVALYQQVRTKKTASPTDLDYSAPIPSPQAHRKQPTKSRLTPNPYDEEITAHMIVLLEPNGTERSDNILRNVLGRIAAYNRARSSIMEHQVLVQVDSASRYECSFRDPETGQLKTMRQPKCKILTRADLKSDEQVRAKIEKGAKKRERRKKEIELTWNTFRGDLEWQLRTIVGWLNDGMSVSVGIVRKRRRVQPDLEVCEELLETLRVHIDLT